MNYRDLATNDNRASLRRIARHEVPEFSNASILKSMETFVRTVNEMEETILVPSRLLDLAVGDAADTVCLKSKQQPSIKDALGNTDLYRLYNIVNQMKVELLWSKESSSANRESEEHERLTKPGHVRCPSTTSMQSVQSASSIASSSSDTESDAGIENDSGLESEDNAERLANQAAENFRRHLRGLHHSINRMTEAAEYLTLRYQTDVGGGQV